SDEIICRFNVLTKGGSLDQNRSGLGALMGATSTTYGAPYFATDGRFYNNSFVKNMGPAVGMYNFFELPVDLGRHKFVNNFMYGSFNDFSTHGYLTIEYWDFDFQTADRYINNVFGHPNGGPDLDFISTKRGRFNFNSALNNLSNPNDPEFSSYLGQSNIYETDPEFVDYQKNNFKLQTTSPYVDAGMSLTHVVSSDTGESKTLRVDDSRFFYGEAAEFPAWMNVQNDWIAVGASFTNSTKTQITDVNDVANVIKLKTDIRRSAGDYVWLFKDSSGREVVFGIAPDIGAYEMRSEDSNTLPIALNDSVETKESWSTSIDVLANDSDADGDLLTIVSYTQPQNGIVMESGGIFMYEPLTDYRGSDSFTYTIADGNGGQANAVVDISVDSTKASGKN
ncbi:MAG: cadherin-like domain-containing protein, partial [Desulfobacteraceae bacterium]